MRTHLRSLSIAVAALALAAVSAPAQAASEQTTFTNHTAYTAAPLAASTVVSVDTMTFARRVAPAQIPDMLRELAAMRVVTAIASDSIEPTDTAQRRGAPGRSENAHASLNASLHCAHVLAIDELTTASPIKQAAPFVLPRTKHAAECPSLIGAAGSTITRAKDPSDMLAGGRYLVPLQEG